MADTRSPRLAVLIDADNASAKIVDGLFDEIAKLGEASVRRIYGDFASPRMKGWTDVLSRHAIIPQQQFAYVTGKNASDISLVIDAMDLMHSGRFDGFCLVSSDSDFTRLAARLRENGLAVYGFGEVKTPESFRQACMRFIYTENLRPASNGDDAPASAPQGGMGEARDLLREVFALAERDETEDGWIGLGEFGKQIFNRYSDFDSRTFGHKKLSDLVRASGLFEIQSGAGGMARIRLKTRNGAAAADAPVEAPKPARPARRRSSARTAKPAKG